MSTKIWPMVKKRGIISISKYIWITTRAGLKRNVTTREMITIFPLWTFHLYITMFQKHLHMEYISLSWCNIPNLCFCQYKVSTNKEATEPLRQFNDRNCDLVSRYVMFVLQITTDMFRFSESDPVLLLRSAFYVSSIGHTIFPTRGAPLCHVVINN